MASLAPNSVLGHYRIEDLLGRGGMGEVYRAVDTTSGRIVALKILPDEVSHDPLRLKRFRREAKAVGMLNHPGICSLYEVGEVEGRTFISMEYIEGRSIHELLANGPLPLHEAIDLAIQIADALEEARSKKIVHRDIKSGNIFVTSQRQVKILDFGLAKKVLQEDGDVSTASSGDFSLSETGGFFGTLTSMAPEQVIGGAVDHRTDIFSFGVVFYEMLTAQLPFSGRSPIEIIESVLQSPPRAIPFYNPQVPDVICNVVYKMMQKKPEDRYKTAAEIAEELRKIRGETPHAKNEQQRKRRWLRPVDALLVLLLIAGVYFVTKQNRQPSASPSAAVQSVRIVAFPAEIHGPPPFFRDAVPATLSRILSNSTTLKVASPPDHIEFTNIKGDWQQAARLYQADAILLMFLSRESERIFLEVAARRPEESNPFWKNKYKGTLDSYNSVIHQAANDITEALKPGHTSLPPLKHASEVELAFQEGLFFSRSYRKSLSIDDYKRSHQALSKAIALEKNQPVFAAEMAMLLAFNQIVSKSDRSSEIRSWAERALKSDPRCGVAWTALAFTEKDPNKKLDYALKGATFAGEDSATWNYLSETLSNISVVLSVHAALRAVELDPLNSELASSAARRLSVIGRQQEAMSITTRLIGTNLSSGQTEISAVTNSVTDLLNKGKTQEALELLESAGDVPYDFLLMNGEIKTFDSDPRFQKIQSDSRLKFEEALTVLQNARAKGEFPPFLESSFSDLMQKLLPMQN